ncbi:hypothetical protein FVE85_8590 [Porphyridium purpureum]|uniref:Uncharacterized protein n=1 Tax=Porphyridium purpureum TaxID=35688 RepID=A0A5J4YPL0_PORPP|nr:hypothetical protein FVE85_8590 [Porphyridium purpureum]|eukprot:POR3466..scf296_7
MDLFFVEGDPILRMVCKHTESTLARYLQNKLAREVIAIFLREWVAYTSGLPESVEVVQGSEFVNMHFCSMINTMGSHVDCESNVAMVKDKSGSQDFSVAVVRRYREAATEADRPKTVYVTEIDGDADKWVRAKCGKLNGLQRRGLFEIMSDPKSGAIVLRSLWTLTEKKGCLEARLIILGHLDKDKKSSVSEAPKLRRNLTRKTVAKYAATNGHKLEVGDGCSAFSQYLWKRGRDIYVLPEAEWDGLGLRLLRKPLCGLADSAPYRSKTTLQALNDLGLEQSFCTRLFSLGENAGIVGIDVNDPLCCGDKNMRIL